MDRLISALLSLAAFWTWIEAKAHGRGSQFALASIGGSPREVQILGTPLWQYFFFLGVIILALILMRIIDFLLDRKACQWTA